MHSRASATTALPPPGSRVHFVGIGGAGMIGLARILLAQGYCVSGSDWSDSISLATLRDLGATTWVGHDVDHVGNAGLVVITAAIPADNVEVTVARARGIPVVKRAALLGSLANARRCIAVAGTHGKSTTSGMVAYILSRQGADPLFVIGAEVRDLGTSARDGSGPLAVVEADEYDYSFLQLTPDVAAITNVEYDHPDIFPDAATYTAAFNQFIGQTRCGGTIILSADDPGCASLAVPENNDVHVKTVGMLPTADWFITLGADGAVTLAHLNSAVGKASLAVAGEHNARNAAMAVAACAAVGIDPAVALRTVAAYRGVGRRFEVIGDASGVTVVDDYAHHPTEVRATLAAARLKFPGHRLIAVFQPHTFSRTVRFVPEFAAALGGADVALVTDIYAAREPDTGTVHARDIVRRMAAGCGEYTGGLDATVDALAARVQAGDVVLTLGAGDITGVGPTLLRRLAAREVGA
jgi:UDP-N-acetylmuramate--alanine ligase